MTEQRLKKHHAGLKRNQDTVNAIIIAIAMFILGGALLYFGSIEPCVGEYCR